MEFFRRTKGVISVFLIIIMLPMLTFAVILVDGTRYNSAKTMVQEAGDLASYSTIANYNMELKDEFGLFAIDDDNPGATYKRYLTETLGYNGNGSQTYSDKVQGLISSAVFGGGDYRNASFVNLYNFDVIAANVQPMHPLSDPGVLQYQIVEYTKYRGIETILERFEILGNFNKVSEATRAAQETTAAVQNLCSIEEIYVTKVSTGAKELQKSVENYNANISKIYEKMDRFYDCVAEELAAMAVMSPSLHNTQKKNRIAAYDDLITHLNQLITDAGNIYNAANQLSSDAQQAKEQLETFIRNHPNQEDACKTAQTDIDYLSAMLQSSDSVYSLPNLKQAISRQQAETLKSSITGKIAPLLRAIQRTYTNYQSELTASKNSGESSEEDSQPAPKARYHFEKAKGGEWYATEEDHTSDGSTIRSFLSSAGTVVTEYLGVIDKSRGKIGSISVDSYKKGFKNKFEAAVENAQKPEREMDVSEALAIEKKSKKDSETAKTQYTTISSGDASMLPSKCASEQSEVSVPDLNEKSASDTLNGASDTAGNIVQKLLESGRDDILVFCYLLDNFKTRVTEKGINSSTDHSGIADKYLVDWRYNSPDGELDMRYRPKKNLDTFFSTNEVEYVFGGSKSEFTNATIVYSWIYGTRFVNNFAAVYSAYSNFGWIRVEIDALAAAASLATGGAVPASVFKWIFITAWAAGETALDLSLLIDDGYRIPLIKTKDNIFIQSIFESGNAFTHEGRKNFVRNPKGSSSITVCYEDYLIMLLAFVDRETRLKRIGDLIQLNMRKRCDANFLLTSAHTYIRADTTVKFKYMFQPVEQFSDTYQGTGLEISNTIYQGY